MKILFKFPSRSRPDRFFETMDSIMKNLTDKVNFHILATLDTDDATMHNPAVEERIMQYPNTSIAWGLSTSKIEAFNRDLPLEGYDILVAVSDDMQFIIYGFDQLIREGFRCNCPDFDGLLHYPDNDAKHVIPVLYIAGRIYVLRDRCIYHRAYKSLFCDNESMAVAQFRGKYFYMGIQIINHLNPAYGHLPRDIQFDMQQALWNVDERTFNFRQSNNFFLDAYGNYTDLDHYDPNNAGPAPNVREVTGGAAETGGGTLSV